MDVIIITKLMKILLSGKNITGNVKLFTFLLLPFMLIFVNIQRLNIVTPLRINAIKYPPPHFLSFINL